MAQGDLTSASVRGAMDLSGLVARRSQGPAASAGPVTHGAPQVAGPVPTGAEPVVPSLVFEVDEQSLALLVDYSTAVPVVVVLDAPGSTGGAEISAFIERAVDSLGGRMLLGRVDIAAQPAIAQAFAASAAPTVAAIIGGRPTPLFQGQIDEQELLGILQQVLDFAAQNGVSGKVTVNADAEAVPAVAPLPPLHQEAYDAIERGDYAAAVAAYRRAIAQNPRDEEAAAGLAQVGLLARLQDAEAGAVRAAAADAPADVDAQLAVADLDVSGGHVEDAFDRLLALFPDAEDTGREAIRARLLDYFALLGAADPRVVTARRRLTNLLY